MKVKDLLENTKVDNNLTKVFKKFVESSKGGHKLIAKVNGKNKTLFAGQTSGGMDSGKHARFEKKCYKFLDETPTFKLEMKMAFSAPMGTFKWKPVGTLDVKDGKIVKEQWFM